MVYSKPDKGGLDNINNELGFPRSQSLSHLQESIDKARIKDKVFILELTFNGKCNYIL